MKRQGSPTSGSDDEPAPTRARRSSSSRRRKSKRGLPDDNEEEVKPIVMSQPETRTNGGFEVAGIIECIEVRNFLCHSHLKMKFNKNVSFVVGVNGSGKSAILTAILIALGERASTTSRGNSTKGLIKTGETQAVIKITLVNTGTGSYKPEVYGSHIIVERTLNISGSGGYKIRNAADRVISTKREELNRIIARMNLQVDNPVCVLNQETAKNFLNSNDPKQRYKLYERATQLDIMQDDMNMASDEIVRSLDCLENKREDLHLLKSTVDKYREKKEAFQNVDDLHEKVMTLQNEAAWAQCDLLEQKAEDCLKTLDRHKALVDRGEDNRKEKLAELELIRTEIEEKNGSATEKMEVAKSKGDELKILEQQVQQLVQQQKSLQQEIRHLERQHQSKTAEKNEIEAAVHGKKNEDLMEQKRQREERLEKIRAVQNEMEETSNTIKTTEVHLNNLKQTQMRLEEEAAGYRNECSQLNRLYEQKKRSLEELNRSSRDQFSLFGDWVPELLHKIERAPFRVKPKGPLGAYVKLRDDSFAPLVEQCLQNRLHSFIVDNDDDWRLLNKLMDETLRREKPTIINSKMLNRKHDVSGHGVQVTDELRKRNIYPMLDVMIVEDPDVFNTLVDNNGIDSLLLFESDSDARAVMSDRTRVPVNCRMAFSKKGNSYYPDPNYRSYPGRCNPRARFLQVSVDEAIRHLTEELETLTEQRSEARAKMDEASRRVATNQIRIREEENRLAPLRKQMSLLRERLNNLREILPEESAPSDVLALEEDLLTVQQTLEQLERDLSSKRAGQDSVKEQLEEVKERCTMSQKASRAASREYNDIKDGIAGLEQRSTEIRQSLARVDQRMGNLKGELERVQREYDAAVELARQEVEKATMLCDRVEARPLQEVQRQLQQLTRQLERQERSLGNREEIFAEYSRIKAEFDRAKTDWNRGKGHCKKLKVMYKDRLKFMEVFKWSVRYRIEHVFLNYMKCSSVPGRLDIDYNEKLLNILVCPPGVNGEPAVPEEGPPQPDNNDRRRSSMMNTNTQSLSGGERSFTTICFILALWDAIVSPFRMLDEFDVFMDARNRRTALTLLLQEATNNLSRQFIFLTPLGVEIEPTSTISVFKMQDPERPNGRHSVESTAQPEVNGD